MMDGITVNVTSGYGVGDNSWIASVSINHNTVQMKIHGTGRDYDAAVKALLDNISNTMRTLNELREKMDP